MKNEVLERLKLQADEHREHTIERMLGADEEYQKALKEMRELENAFEHLPLSPSQRQVIEAYLQAWDDIQFEYSTYAYLAGIHDALEDKNRAEAIFL